MKETKTENRHCHWQIQYTGVETLSGFDPRNQEDRKFVHENLDEYLDYLANKIAKTSGNVDCDKDPMGMEADRFIVFGHIDM